MTGQIRAFFAGRRWIEAVLASLCGGLGIGLLVLWLAYDHGSTMRQQEINHLACQVQRLGGQPVGGVHCPAKRRPAAPTATPTPMPAPSPGSTVIVRPTFTTTRPLSTPAPASSTAMQPPTARPKPTPAPTATPTPSPTPLLPVCLPLICPK